MIPQTFVFSTSARFDIPGGLLEIRVEDQTGILVQAF